MKCRIIPSAIIGLVVLAALGAMRQDDSDKKQTTTTQAATTQAATTQADDEFTLENIFPKKGLFGPSARSMAFSYDGKYAAYLYRPYKERRHGSDLWIYNPGTGESKRVTAVSVMSKFQADTRKVKEDRIKKAKKARKKQKTGDAENDKKLDADDKDKKSQDAGDKDKKSKDGGDGEQEKGGESDALEEAGGAKDDKADQDKEKDDEDELGDWVSDKDADDEKAPRYAGINSYTWSPNANELLFTSGGDIYRYTVEKDEIQRLTRTQERERGVAYLPDASGYSFMRGAALLKVTFGSHLIEQIDPKLGKSESMSSYRLSPDGKRVVFLATKSGKTPAPQRKVKIAKYRDRFMQVTEMLRRYLAKRNLKPIRNYTCFSQSLCYRMILGSGYCSTLHTAHCTLHTAHCTLHTAHCTLHTAHRRTVAEGPSTTIGRR